MKEHQLLLKGEMVRVVLGGRKTQTRCPIVPQPMGKIRPIKYPTNIWSDFESSMVIKCPWQVGDRLWVRETLRRKYNQKEMESYITYVADITPVFNKNPKEKFPHLFRPTWYWKRDTLPSIHMPRWASRITLEITDIRAERIREITDLGCEREGFKRDNDGFIHPYFTYFWDSIYVKKGYGWNTNCWVWVREFRRLEEEDDE